MTDEEKKAIKKIDIIVKECELKFKTLGYECDLYDEDEPIPVNEYRTLLNLIEKQQKEIDRLDKDNKKLDREKQKLFEDIFKNIVENYVPKEAIREKMKQLEITDCTIRYNKYDIQDILKEILGE